jgi:hypothetical protein
MKSGEWKLNGRTVYIIPMGSSYKSSTKDNKGRYIHVGAKTEHIDNLEERKKGNNQHMGIAELVTISLKDLPKTVPVPWNYPDFCLGVAVPNIEVETHSGSITVKGRSQPAAEILIGSADPSQTWY